MLDTPTRVRFDAVLADFSWVDTLANGLATAVFISIVVYCLVRIIASIIEGLRTSRLGPFFLTILAKIRRKAENSMTTARSKLIKTMTVPPPNIEIREEIVDPLLAEREKNRAASRAIAFIILLNGIAAIVILTNLTQGTFLASNVERFADAMMVFGAGAAAALASALFAYLRRSLNAEMPLADRWRRPLPWLTIAGAIIGVVCFLAGLNMARIAVQAGHLTSIVSPKKPHVAPPE